MIFLVNAELKVLLNGGRLELGGRGDGDGEAVIIGGMVLDIHAVPSTPLISGTTSPGNVFLLLTFPCAFFKKKIFPIFVSEVIVLILLDSTASLRYFWLSITE